MVGDGDGDGPGADEEDIEAEIKREVASLSQRPAKRKALFRAVRLDIQCGMFISRLVTSRLVISSHHHITHIRNKLLHTYPTLPTYLTTHNNFHNLAINPSRASDIPVLFFQTRAPVEPVSFVHRLCSDAAASSEESRRNRSRWVLRLTPMTLMGKATEKGLEGVARTVLAPHFHRTDGGECSAKKVRLSELRVESASFLFLALSVQLATIS